MTDAAALNAFSRSKHDACVSHFSRCDKSKAGSICAGLTNRFNQDVLALASTYEKLADGQARGLRPKLEEDRSWICSSKPDELNAQTARFQGSCESALQAVRSMYSEATDDCRLPPQKSFALTQPTVFKAACEKAAQGELKKTVGEVCAGAGVCFALKECPENTHKEDDGRCHPDSIVK